jgi:hypothetical protein
MRRQGIVLSARAHSSLQLVSIHSMNLYACSVVRDYAKLWINHEWGSGLTVAGDNSRYCSSPPHMCRLVGRWKEHLARSRHRYERLSSTLHPAVPGCSNSASSTGLRMRISLEEDIPMVYQGRSDKSYSPRTSWCILPGLYQN